MNKQVTVSVVMPNYNGELYLRQAINSVLNQTYHDFEFIIVDDASTDNSREIIESFKDPRIRCIQGKRNEHICHALNVGLAAAKSKYIARIDSDDFWYENKLEKQIEYLETHPECGACFTWVDVIGQNERKLSEEDTFHVSAFRTENRAQSAWLRQFFFNGSCLCHPSVVMTRKALEAVGSYNMALVQIQDFDMWIRIAKKFALYVIQEPLMGYRWIVNAGNVSAQSSATENRSRYEFYYVLSHYFDDMSDELFREAFSGDFIKKDANTHEDYLCEQALLLQRSLFCGYASKIAGLDRLAELINSPNTRDLLRKEYSLSQKDFYSFSALPVLYTEPSLAIFSSKQMIREIISRRLRKN